MPAIFAPGLHEPGPASARDTGPEVERRAWCRWVYFPLTATYSSTSLLATFVAAMPS